MSPQNPQQGVPIPQGPAPSQPPSLMQQGGVGPFSKARPMPGNAPGYQQAGPVGPGAPEGFGGNPLGPMQIAGNMQNIPRRLINGPGQQGAFGGPPGV